VSDSSSEQVLNSSTGLLGHTVTVGPTSVGGADMGANNFVTPGVMPQNATTQTFLAPNLSKRAQSTSASVQAGAMAAASPAASDGTALITQNGNTVTMHVRFN
jgi:hypothetical protein